MQPLQLFNSMFGRRTNDGLSGNSDSSELVGVSNKLVAYDGAELGDFQKWGEYLVGYKAVKPTLESLHDGQYTYRVGEINIGVKGLWFFSSVKAASNYVATPIKILKVLIKPTDILSHTHAKKLFVMSSSKVYLSPTQIKSDVVWYDIHLPEGRVIAGEFVERVEKERAQSIPSTLAQSLPYFPTNTPIPVGVNTVVTIPNVYTTSTTDPAQCYTRNADGSFSLNSGPFGGDLGTYMPAPHGAIQGHGVYGHLTTS